MKKIILAAVLAAASLNLQAVPLFVGSYQVNDGPWWTTNPDVYSATEAAALIFGGSDTDYFISIIDSLDYTTITHTGWYDGWGEHSGMEFDENYSLDVGNDGYQFPSATNSARSAYVHDGLNDSFVNYVWTSDVNVPEPAGIALLGLGLLGVGFSIRKRKA
ncbi:PEP-CTERM sorting domain-containing protein [Psychromonas aquimarina]|uniref:PEP-CTERM sorting domain-containing protein n=1 Tax=Psychromonas aquimarina TaxID=444919 RepID=UPI0004026AFB|nr:PEP-CTERM sorting domain-containing protein [Psychromonas aquimarina]